jgi:hypothetical protein
MKLVIGALAMALVGCAGARTTVIAEGSHYPVSLSRAIRDADGNLVPAERRTVVGTFRAKKTAWNLVWSAAKLTPTTDISDDVNEQVAAAHGDAIIHLVIVTTHCALNYFAFPMGVLPFWPSCADIDVTGDIVKVSATPTTTATPTAQPQVGL